MPSADPHALPPEAPVDCLLFSAPHPSVADHLAAVLAAAGAQLEACDVGLKMRCEGIDWKPLVRAAAQSLSHPERRDIRIAPVPAGDGIGALSGAMFNAHRLEEFVDRIASEWLIDLLARDAIAVHFQPLVQFPPGRIHGYECFARGIPPGGPPLAPA
ncbi:MAG: hypothetical protein JWM97_1567, partial [Phycisphaerales bacterium]|nr:hypothetical protein [Phycisphaerales bacterium]